MAQDIRTAQNLARIRQMVRGGHARRIRLASFLSQAEVADALGVSPSAVARWESGSRLPHGDEALLYLELLNSLAVELAGSAETGPAAMAGR